jgi:hypothetical protein
VSSELRSEVIVCLLMLVELFIITFQNKCYVIDSSPV